MNKLLLLTIGVWSCGAIARAAEPIVAPLTIPEVVADDSAVWAGITSGQMSVAQAWKDGLLDAATVQAGLAKGVASGQSEKAMQIRRELGGLLIQNAPEVVAKPETLPTGVHLALADYYASVGDERAALLYEAVIAQTKAPYEKALRLLALGEFWSGHKEPQKAQDVFARGREVLLKEGHNPHLAAEMLLNTAIAWSLAGDEEKARQFYDKTVADGDGWMSGMALYDQANTLIQRNQKEEARGYYQQVKQYGLDAGIADGDKANLLLKKRRYEDVVSFLEKSISEIKDPLMRVVLFKTMAQASIIGGNLSKAGEYARSSLREFDNLPQPDTNVGVAQQASGARDILDQVKTWQSRPIIPEVRTVAIVQSNPVHLKAPRKLTLKVFTFDDTPIVITSSSPSVQAVVAENGKRGEVDRHSCYEREISISVDDTAFSTVSSIVLTLQSPRYPNFSAPIELALESSRT